MPPSVFLTSPAIRRVAHFSWLHHCQFRLRLVRCPGFPGRIVTRAGSIAWHVYIGMSGDDFYLQQVSLCLACLFVLIGSGPVTNGGWGDALTTGVYTRCQRWPPHWLPAVLPDDSVGRGACAIGGPLAPSS